MNRAVFILIPMYQAGAFVRQTIESVLGQTHNDWSLLILDDASTDEGPSIAQEYASKDPRIVYMRNRANLGMLENWNEGIRQCKKELFVKLDADDVWYPSFLEESLNVLEKNPDVALVFTKYETIDPNGTVTGTQEEIPNFALEKPFGLVQVVKEGPDKFLGHSILRQGVSLIRTKVLNELGGYRALESDDTQASTDTDFYFRVGCRHKIYCINKVLYQYRQHPSSVSRKDEAGSLNSKKIYEAKRAIIRYYLSEGKLGFKAASGFLAKVEADYLIRKSALQRKNGRTFSGLISIWKALNADPFRTILFFAKRLR